MSNEPLTDGQAVIVVAVMYLFQSVGIFGVMQKADRFPTWKAFVPVLNLIELCHIAGVSAYWLLFLFLPGLNLVVAINLGVRLVQKFSWSSPMGVMFGFTGFALLPVLGFSQAVYQPEPEAKFPDSIEDNVVESATSQNSPKALMIAITVSYGIAILCWPGLLVIGAMAFDAPGSHNSLSLKVSVFSILSAPLTMLLSMIVSWVIYSRGNSKAAIATMIIPVIHFLGLSAGLALALFE